MHPLSRVFIRFNDDKAHQNEDVIVNRTEIFHFQNIEI